MKKRRYVHWLRINATLPTMDVCKQYREIETYLGSYPDATAEQYIYDYVLCDRVVRLACGQKWNNLDLDANTGSHGLQRLVSKPKHITSRGDFKTPEYITKYLNSEQNPAAV